MPKYPRTMGMTDKQIFEALYPTNYEKPTYKIPDFEYIHSELKRDGVTRDLLWREYVEECHQNGELPYQRSSTIFCSQFDVPGWHDKFSSPLIADAICDRIAHDSYRILIESTESMRKRKGVSA